MKIAVSAESTIDLTKELLTEYGIFTVPFTITLGDITEKDGEITNDRIIAYVNEHKVLPKTSAVNEQQFDEHFKNLLKTHDAIIHFSLSKELSSAYNNAVSAAKNFKNVYVIDTRSLSTGIAGLLFAPSVPPRIGCTLGFIPAISMAFIAFSTTSICGRICSRIL